MANERGMNEAMHVERQTAPQEPYTLREVGIGAVVAIIGLIIVFGIPILTTV